MGERKPQEARSVTVATYECCNALHIRLHGDDEAIFAVAIIPREGINDLLVDIVEKIAGPHCEGHA